MGGRTGGATTAVGPDLVNRQVAVVVAGASRAVVAAKGATSTIPVVFWTGVDPIKFGLVKALNHPGGNLTGFTLLSGELVAKQLQLIREVAPDARIVAALIDGNDPNGGNVASILQAAARSLGVELVVLYAGDESELEDTFAKIGQLRPGGLVISVNAFLFQRHKYMADFANGHGIPAISTNPFAMAGGLMSYSASLDFHGDRFH